MTEHRDPRPAAVSFVTTEHFTLQGARSATIAESTGRATMFLGAVSGGLIALGLFAQATHLDATFYTFALILLPTLALLGVLTFQRAYQSGREDAVYADRIARLRAYYVDVAPELEPFLLDLEALQRQDVLGLSTSRTQKFLTVAGTVAVITSIITGATAGLLSTVLSGHPSLSSFVIGGVVACVTLAALMRHIAIDMAGGLYGAQRPARRFGIAVLHKRPHRPGFAPVAQQEPGPGTS